MKQIAFTEVLIIIQGFLWAVEEGGKVLQWKIDNIKNSVGIDGPERVVGSLADIDLIACGGDHILALNK